MTFLLVAIKVWIDDKPLWLRLVSLKLQFVLGCVSRSHPLFIWWPPKLGRPFDSEFLPVSLCKLRTPRTAFLDALSLLHTQFC